ncbi:MAG: glutamate synthase subunit beta [Lachnospiraceae bacterium]|jgi:glutamate synthase (NADPH/NADH) small chain|nr:glutamate synthase subunit beta [Lachnospiraceae bacterium]MCI1397203.1 glutamate synthase subunit beta [Lachnospiraceae bacterium]MCI1423045.1 glutamate synthase subunit beta [Lachnospiraceae bacterium]MCI1451846.1 glutamate synthase subunit beta [Lachnospiraceae bacterium]MDD5849571.1 glutamate synthase subunit beta [Bacillota bacterium]
MGKTTGFLDYQRKANGDIPPKERIQNFSEFHTYLDEEDRSKQAGRCMNCGVPLCQSAMKLSGMVTGCPLHNLIPEWNDEVWQGHVRYAFTRLQKTSNFPEFTGRVCPALCEKACINGEYGEPVTIHDNELYIIETAWAKGTIQPRIPRIRSGKRVAVVGSGPAGLACADELNHRGHLVTVLEREDRIGGLLMYGIPNMKLDKSVIARRRKLMEEEGVVFETGVNVGVTVTAEELLKKYDAVVLACGAKQPRALAGADPEKTPGVYYAVDFLKSTTKALLATGSVSAADFRKATGYISAKDKNVVVVGGGDTGNDCIGTCIRHGCKSITALEMMPEPPLTRTVSNPWPEWPKVKKTDYGHEEAIAVFGKDPRVYETTVKEIHTNKKGELREIVTVKVKFENRKIVEIPGTEQTLKCELLLIAAGFTGCEKYTAEAFGTKLTQRGTVETAAEDAFATSVNKVFTAGDMHRGQSLVVWAITEGRRCARDVDLFLMGYSNLRES